MKLVILDRDGVINEDSPNYIKSVAEWHPIPGSLEAIGRLCQNGYRVCVASNQSGIGRGLFDYDALFAMNDKLQKLVGELGGRIDAFAFAPEHPDEATHKRKPNPGMLNDLSKRLGVSLENVPFVGDSHGDLQAAKAAGAKPVLVRTGNGRKTEAKHGTAATAIYDDLASFVSAHLAHTGH